MRFACPTIEAVVRSDGTRREIKCPDCWGRGFIDYGRIDYKWRSHHARWTRHVTERRPRLVCQDCHGMGGETVPILDDGTGPFETCGWCSGVGYVSAWVRGEWLRDQQHRRKVT